MRRGAHKGSYQGIKKETPQTAVSGYAEKYVRVVHVSRSELSTSQVSEMRDAVATDLQGISDMNIASTFLS